LLPGTIRWRWAANIRDNAKGKALLTALDRAFAELNRLNAPKKAIIFTESRRTQNYLPLSVMQKQKRWNCHFSAKSIQVNNCYKQLRLMGINVSLHIIPVDTGHSAGCCISHSEKETAK
jgi:hypothetical protein